MNRYIFDYKELKKWNISLKKLPKDTVFINKPVFFVKKYFLIFLLVLIFLSVETLIIISLVINIIMRRKTEKDLKLKSEEVERYFNYTRDLISIRDTKGIFLVLNPEWELTLGYELKKMKGKNFLDFVHPDDIVKTSDFMLTLIREKRTINYTNRFRCKNGNYRFIEWRSIFSEDMIYSSGRDITEKISAEESLQKSEESFSALYLNMSEGVAIHETIYDKEGIPVNYKITAINPQYGKILNIKPEDVINKLATEVYHTDNPPYLVEFASVGETGIPHYFETYFPPLDKHFAISVAYIRKGKWATIFSDITEKKKTEEERNRLFNLSIDMLCIATFNGYLKQVNPAWIKTLGWSEDELLSHPWLYFVHPDDKNATIMSGEKLIRGENVLNFSNRYLHKDGSYRWLSWNSFPLIETKEMFGVVRDITEQKRAEEQIIKINRLYLVLSNINQCIVRSKDINKVFLEACEILINDGMFAYAWIGLLDENKSGLKITSTSGLEEKTVEELQKVLSGKEKKDILAYRVLEKKAFVVINFPEKQNFYDKTFFKKIFKKEAGVIGVFPLYKNDDIVGIINISSYDKNYFDELEIKLLEELSGDISHSISVFEQDGKRKIAEEEIQRLNKDLAERVYKRTQELEEANKELESFSYSVSHDLRAPLRHINGFVGILIEEAEHKLSEENVRQLLVISDSAKRMGDLIDSLLEFSRMSKGDLHFSPVDMHLLVNRILLEFQEESNTRKINWIIGELPTVTGDEILLRQVWENLISNAVKYTKEQKNPVIEIDFKVDNEQIIFFVKDNGIGFNMKFVNKLFGVFQRLHVQEEFEGIGIGLANVKKIVLRHNGKVWAEGKPFEGATFYFSLPFVK